MLRTSRAAALVLVFGGLGLTVPEQTDDMLVFLSDGQATSWIAYQIALVMLAFCGWFWSRAAVTAQYGTWPSPEEADKIDWFAFRWTPRLALFAAVAIGVVIALKDRSFWSAGTAAVLGAVAVWLARWRTLDQGSYRNGDHLSPTNFRTWRRGGGLRRFVRLITQAPGGAWLAVPVLSISLIILTLNILEPFIPRLELHQWLATEFPGPSVAVLGLGLMIGPLTVLTFVLDGIDARFKIGAFKLDIKRTPVLIPLAFCVFVATPALTHLHPVRLLPAKLPDKASLPSIFANWVKVCAPRGVIRPVIVAMSGGATRSGLWGAAVLDRVLGAQQIGGPAIFAVSSVSGGSLGAAGAMSLLRKAPVPCLARDLEELRPEQLRREEVRPKGPPHPPGPTPLAGDALGPLLAGWLFDDIPRAFTYPVTWLVRIATKSPYRGSDSAAAIEQAFTRLWSKTGIGGVDWDDPFLSLFYDDTRSYRPGMPLWFANGTDATTGNRVITSPIAASEPDWPFRGARDFHALMHADARIATVINNTARFPYLEPFGELLPAMPGGLAGALADQAVGSLIDGGYFENEGLQTALDLAEWLGRQKPDGRDVLPIIVQATGDGDANVMTPDVMTCSVASDGPDLPAIGQSALQVLAPLAGLTHVRGGHSAVLLRQAHDDFCGRKDGQEKRPRFVHFYLPADRGRPVPLNWVLSEETARFIWSAFSDRQVCNAGQLAVLAAAMASGDAPAPEQAACALPAAAK